MMYAVKKHDVIPDWENKRDINPDRFWDIVYTRYDMRNLCKRLLSTTVIAWSSEKRSICDFNKLLSLFHITFILK